jgi:hypothetical protein
MRVRLAIALLSLCACSRSSKQQRAGSIEGDVYLSMQSGDAKRASGLPVSLVKYSPTFDSTLHAVCEGFARSGIPIVLHALAMRDSQTKAILAGNIERVDAISGRMVKLDVASDSIVRDLYRTVRSKVAKSVVDTTGTGMNAHFRFDSVAAGRYIVFAEWTVGQNPYHWWAPVTVDSGRVRRDLDNSVEGGDQPFCGQRRVNVLGRALD